MKAKFLLLVTLLLPTFVSAEINISPRLSLPPDPCILSYDYNRIVEGTGYMSNKDRNKFLEDIFSKSYVVVEEEKDCPLGTQRKIFLY